MQFKEQNSDFTDIERSNNIFEYFWKSMDTV